MLKLDFYGIRGKTKRWTEDFLSNRTQQVVVEGEHSHTGSVASGVPQGSVLEPSLFLIYTNDLGDAIKTRLRIFADDTILYSVIRTPTDSIQLQDDPRTLESWERRWLMSFNVENCHQLAVTKKRNRIPTSPQPNL